MFDDPAYWWGLATPALILGALYLVLLGLREVIRFGAHFGLFIEWQKGQFGPEILDSSYRKRTIQRWWIFTRGSYRHGPIDDVQWTSEWFSIGHLAFGRRYR